MVPAGCLHPLLMKCARLKWCRVFKCSSRSAACLVQQPGANIQAVKKPGRSLLSETEEKLEDYNLFRIRKSFGHCTIMCSKISNKVNRNGRNPEFRKK